MAELTELGKNACAAKYILQKLTTEEKNKALDLSLIHIYTGIALDSLPEKIQMQIMDMLSIPDEETLYDFLETYSS